jgi:hypothetical protein
MQCKLLVDARLVRFDSVFASTLTYDFGFSLQIISHLTVPELEYHRVFKREAEDLSGVRIASEGGLGFPIT